MSEVASTKELKRVLAEKNCCPLVSVRRSVLVFLPW